MQKKTKSTKQAQPPVLAAPSSTPTEEPFHRLPVILQRPPIEMRDGTTLSIQANEFVYCQPRANEGPYSHVELGFPSARIEEIMPWADEEDCPTETVYPRVPIEVVARAILARGGRVDAPETWTPRCMGGGVAPQPVFTGFPDRRKIDASEGISGLSSAFFAWIQAAALGSPVDERAAQFDVVSGGHLVLGWDELAAKLALDPNSSSAEALGHALGKALSDAEHSLLDACSATPRRASTSRKTGL